MSTKFTSIEIQITEGFHLLNSVVDCIHEGPFLALTESMAAKLRIANERLNSASDSLAGDWS
jgi:hypothetical protein